MRRSVLFQLFSVFVFLRNAQGEPNVILIIVDDQEFESMMQDPDPVESEDPMPELRKEIKNKGTTLANFFTTTPSCCISRATIFSGQYGHHCEVTGNKKPDGCYNAKWRKNEEHNFPAKISESYNSFFMGKYLNMYGSSGCLVPDGWRSVGDAWYGVTSGDYYDYTLCEKHAGSSSETGAEVTYSDSSDDYITKKMAEKAKAFLNAQSSSTPFLMVLAPPNPHGPTTYIEEDYGDKFADMEAWTDLATETSPADKHYMMRYIEEEDDRRTSLGLEPVDESRIKENADKKFRHRYRTLRHVDDMVKELVPLIDFENTYFMYTSDNGYHFNQHGRVHGKWLNYDTDIRVPFFIRGPNIPAGQFIHHPVLNMDLAPTILEIAGVDIPDDMDGASFVTLVETGADSNWRTDFLVEYWGKDIPELEKTCKVSDSTYTTSEGEEGANCCAISKEIPGTCPESCAESDTCENQNCETEFSNCLPVNECICSDHSHNTYNCIREVVIENDEITKNYAYCEFNDDGDSAKGTPFIEAYDLLTDKYQTKNLAEVTDGISENDRAAYDARIATLKTCKGKSECS